jgi:1,4-dihydroxy-2-naphthoate polyprenyltransferase
MLKSIFLALRPKTLTASVVPCLAATALAQQTQKNISLSLLWSALVSAIFIQITTNLVNDAVDFEKGADTEARIGPQRITASGALKPKQTLFLAHISALLALVFSIPLVLAGGTPIIVLGLVSIAMAYAYTAGPMPLAYHGLGDVFVVLFFGLFAVSGMFYIHTKQLSLNAGWLGLQIGFLATVLIAINNFRDHATDVLVNKKTLAVRLGPRFSRFEIAFLLITPFLMNLWWIAYFGWDAFIIPLIAFPLAFFVIKKIFQEEPSTKYNKYLGLAAAVHLIFGIALAYAIVA